MALFESYERRIDKINSVLNSYGIASIEEAEKITKDAGLDVYDQVKKIQPICFENACWAYIVGAAIAIKKDCRRAADAAAAIGEGLQSFCIPGSVADQRKVGLGHGNLGKMLLEEETDCFCFLAGHESFAAAEGAIGIAEKANKVRQKPLRVILNGLGKDAAQIISRINGFTYVETEMDYYTGEVKELWRKSYSEGLRAKVNCCLLYTSNGTQETSGARHLIARLPFGSYILEEQGVPYDQGYIQAMYMGLILQDTDQVQKYFLQNEFTKTAFAKLDVRTQKEIRGAVMTLYRATSSELMEKSRQSRIEDYISNKESDLQTSTHPPYLIK